MEIIIFCSLWFYGAQPLQGGWYIHWDAKKVSVVASDHEILAKLSDGSTVSLPRQQCTVNRSK